MARPRKVIKRVTITIQADMSATAFKELKKDLKEKIESALHSEMEIVYLAVDSDTKE